MKTKELKIGAGDNSSTEVTPLISKEQIKRVSNYVKSGVQSGAAVRGQRFRRAWRRLAEEALSELFQRPAGNRIHALDQTGL